MKNLARTLLVVALSLGIATASNAQQSKTIPGSFAIVNNNHPEKEEFYKTSIGAADMEQYRLRDSRVHLEFENGFEVELYSAKELFVNNPSLTLSNYPMKHGNDRLPLFGVLPTGHLTAKVYTQEKK